VGCFVPAMLLTSFDSKSSCKSSKDFSYINQFTYVNPQYQK
jgi:hypothetical protein